MFATDKRSRVRRLGDICCPPSKKRTIDTTLGISSSFYRNPHALRRNVVVFLANRKKYTRESLQEEIE